MNKPIIYLAVVLMSLSGCTKMTDKKDALVLGTNASYPPYESVDKNGNIVGFDIDVAKAIAQKLGKKLVVQNMSFDGLILALKQDKFDMIMGGISITPSRQEQIVMVPYQGEEVKSLCVLFWKTAPDGLKSISDLTKLGDNNIAVQTGTYMENRLSQVKGIRPKALEGTTELVMDIQYKKSIAAVVEPHIAETLMPNYPELKRVDIQLSQDDWVLGNGIGINKGHTQTINDIQEAVAALRKEGILKELEMKWFGRQQT